MTGRLPIARRAGVKELRNPAGDLLDHALVLWFPGPATVTGEDVVELHVHGGRAVIAAVLAALAEIGCRMAIPGEFTRRALFNGKINLSEVEGLADLLAAETESQRRDAVKRADGFIARRFSGWRDRLLLIAAQLEAIIDYDGDEDVAGAGDDFAAELASLATEMDAALAVAPAERLRDGVRVVIVGPPNAGKSTLFNALVGRDAAIVSDIAGTTRDAIERPVAIDGVPFVLVDTAGIREADDPVERMGIDRAQSEQARADIVIDLVSDALQDGRSILVSTKADVVSPRPGALAVSAIDGQGIAALQQRLCRLARTMLPAETEVALDRRYRDLLAEATDDIKRANLSKDILLVAEHVRLAHMCLDRVLGGDSIEDMLDALFGRFCLGK
jgi:tRNA modification GTPase